MPIAVACACGAKLKAPDSTAGKRVKCPKCSDPITVPAAEVDYEVVEDSPPTPAKKKPQLVEDDDEPPRPMKTKAKAPVEVDEAVDDDDGEEEEDEKPKKKKGGKRKTGKNREEEKKKRTLTLILGLCGAVIVLGAAGGVIAFAVNMKDPSKVPPPTQPAAPPLPSGWSTFKGDGFSVAVPDSVGFKEQALPPQAGAAGKQPADSKNYVNGTATQQGQPVWVYNVTSGSATEKELEDLKQNPDKVWAELKKQAEKSGAKMDDGKPFSAGGLEGREFAVSIDFIKLSGVMRIVVKGNKVYTWGALGQNNPTLSDQNLKPFFDTFKLD